MKSDLAVQIAPEIAVVFKTPGRRHAQAIRHVALEVRVERHVVARGIDRIGRPEAREDLRTRTAIDRSRPAPRRPDTSRFAGLDLITSRRNSSPERDVQRTGQAHLERPRQVQVRHELIPPACVPAKNSVFEVGPERRIQRVRDVEVHAVARALGGQVLVPVALGPAKTHGQ